MVMKICIVSHEYPPNMLSGPGSFIANLVDGLLSAGHSVTIITPHVKGSKRYEKDGRLEVYRIDLHSKNSVKRWAQGHLDSRLLLSFAMRGMKKEIDLNSFDLLHIIDAHDSYFIDDSIRIPIIISINDIYSFITPYNYFRFPFPCTDKKRRYLFYNLTKILGKKYIKRADFLIANSHCLTRNITKFCGVPEDRIATIYRGIDIGMFRPLVGTAGRKKYSSREVLFVGGNMERKGVRFLVEAMPKICRAFPDAHFTLIGKAGPRLIELFMKTIKANGLERNVTFIEHVPREEIAEYYARANAFVLNSGIEIDVGLAQSLLESMSSGTPVVCTDDQTNRFVIKDAGIFIRPRDSDGIANAVIELFSNSELAEQMGRSGVERIKKMFHKDRMIRETIDVYERVFRLGGSSSYAPRIKNSIKNL